MSKLDELVERILVLTVDLVVMDYDAVAHPKITGATYVAGEAQPTMVGPVEALNTQHGSDMPNEIVKKLVEKLDELGYEIRKKS